MADSQGLAAWLPLALTLFLAYLPVKFIYNVYYNVYLHPLSAIPGPTIWSSSHLPFLASLLRGTFVPDLSKLHRRYGPVVRTGPGQVSLASPDLWSDVFMTKPGHQSMPKDPIWAANQPPGNTSLSLFTAIDPEEHARIRRVFAPAFTTRALQSQEAILRRYVNLLVEQLRRITVSDKTGRDSAVVDIVPWFNFTTFDIFGDLGFGESFECLQSSKYHPWIALLFDNMKAACFLAATRYYPIIETILLKSIPPSLQKSVDDHFQHIKDKIQRRLNYELDRPDIMSHIIKAKDGLQGMTEGEVNTTMMLMAVAGSETTATTLSGILSNLVNCPEKLATLTAEIRNKFSDQNDINLMGLQDLPYLNAVIKEGLRLCPPNPWILPRQVPPAGQVVCGVWLPGGTSVFTMSYAMNTDPTYFHSPTTFLPERWLPETRTNPTSPLANDKLEVAEPFAVGPRSCIGKHLALAELRLILSALLWNFDFEATENTRKQLRWDDLMTYILVKMKPVDVVIKLREVS